MTENLARNLEIILNEKGLNILALSKKIKCSDGYLYDIKNKNAIPSLPFLQKIADGLGVEVSELLK